MKRNISLFLIIFKNIICIKIIGGIPLLLSIYKSVNRKLLTIKKQLCINIFVIFMFTPTVTLLSPF